MLNMRFLTRRNEPILLVLLVFALAGFGYADPRFLSLGTLVTIAQQTAVISVVAFAMTAVIIARGIDISVGSTLAVAGIVAALVFGRTGSSAATLAAAILAGASVGLLNGGLIGFIGISPFIATLATMALARGAALSLSDSSSIPVDDPLLLWAGNGNILGVPAALIIALACLVSWWLLFNRTLLGRWIFVVGGNRTAARASLVPVRRVEILVYVITGAAAGVGAIITLGRLGSAQPLAGTGLEFSAITAAVIGGAKLSGGEGSVIGTAIGAVLLGVINAGLSFMEISQQTIYYVTGGLVITAVLISQPEAIHLVLSRLRKRRSHGARSSTTLLTEGHSLKLEGLGKVFPGVKALDSVSFSISPGDIVALVGENGAGKSTLVKCIAGTYIPDEGVMRLDGAEVVFKSPNDARGISVIHQHFSLVPDLSVLENLFLGREKRTLFGTLDRRSMEHEARRVISELGLSINLHAELSSLTVGHRQMVEIARAILADAWLFVMDEPTSALTNRERDHLYAIIDRLMTRGAAILYISHRMDEIFTLTQRIVVLRDGKFVGERLTASVNEREVISMMVGRDVTSVFPYEETTLGPVVLAVQHLSDGGLLQDVSLEVRAGELVVISGLMGSGRSEVLRCIAGLAPVASGSIRVADQLLVPSNIKASSDAGVALVPEDRHLEGFVGTLSIRDNLSLVWMRAHSQLGFINPTQLTRLASSLVASLGVRPAELDKKVKELSGGNQQKVVIGKWLATEPKLLLLDEPTQGVDVGAKCDLHTRVAELKRRGTAILMVSSELPEVLGVADRILVMHRGRIVGELARGATENEVAELAFGRVAAPLHQANSGRASTAVG
jgi:ribose transport system ATP-binding protein